LIAPFDAPAFEEHVLVADPRFERDPEFDRSRSWVVIQGKPGHSALIETEPGSTASEVELAEALSKRLGVTIDALRFCGYDDPDHGLPSIERYDARKSGLIWRAPSDDDDEDELETVAGPAGVPRTDPFEFAAALGFALRPYYRA
jgi:hypothetical protein